jgi:hypothetical protein
MKFTWLLSVAVLVASSLVLSGAQSRADVTLPTTLDKVVGQTFTVGDKVFNVLAATPSGTQPPSLSAITVSAVPPVGFTLSGPVVSALSAAGELETSDLAVTYTENSAPGDFITKINLAGIGASVGPLSSVSVAETIVNNADGKIIGTGTLFGSGFVSIVLSESATSITITKDILATAGGIAGANANYSSVTQAVPEPTSIAMLGLGLVGIGTVWLRRRLRTV